MPLPKETAGIIHGRFSTIRKGLIDLMGGKDSFNRMMDSVFVLPPVFDKSYYGSVIHEIRGDADHEHGQLRSRQPAHTAHDLPL